MRSPEEREQRRLKAYDFRARYRASEKPLIVGKRCSICKQLKAGVGFYGCSSTPDGLVPACKLCMKVSRRRPEVVAANRRRCAAYKKTEAGRAADHRGHAKYRKTAKGKLTAAAGAARFRASGGHDAMLLRWQSRPEVKAKLRESCRRYQATKRAVTVEVVSPSAVWERDGGLCWMCCEPVTLLKMQIDHVVPISRGGEHSYANCKTSCRRCNLHKGSKLPSELGLKP